VVAGDVAPHEDHGGRVAHDLLDGPADPALEVLQEQRPLVGEVGEQLQRVAQRRPGRLVARDDEQQEERPELADGQALPVDVGGDERRDQVAGRVPGALAAEAGGEPVQVTGRPDDLEECAR
jgi:hypothetical protein